MLGKGKEWRGTTMARRKRRKDIAPVFKPYDQDQMLLLPPSLEEMIPSNHLVRTVNELISRLAIHSLVNTYKGGGTSSYHPMMMLKVIVYGYLCKIYSARQIAKALRENVAFMWLSGGNRPDFRTINNFRSGRMKEAIDSTFGELVEILLESGFISFEKYFLDGTKLEADANRHKVIWSKNTQRYKEKAKEEIREHLRRIDEINERENREYGDRDLEELGGSREITAEEIERTVKRIDERLAEKPNKEMEREKRKVEGKYLPKLAKYEMQEKNLGGRKSYSPSDIDATVMMMKDGKLAPGYNVQLGTENQFVLGFSVHQQAGDSGLLIPHLEKVEQTAGRKPDVVIADSAYGSEENYCHLEKKNIDGYLKYNTFHKEQERKYRENRFSKDNLIYHLDSDCYECPAGRKLVFKKTAKGKTDNGYEYVTKVYECEDCAGCGFSEQCRKGKGNRSISVNETLNEYRYWARQKLSSDVGIELRKQRNIEIESVFGDLKQNMSYRRARLKGLEKINCEIGLLSMAHNLKKVFASIIKDTVEVSRVLIRGLLLNRVNVVSF
ncbi:MAG: IS1182 family transposase [Spirochaetota bacterium]